jgi:hypothetical protein
MLSDLTDSRRIERMGDITASIIVILASGTFWKLYEIGNTLRRIEILLQEAAREADRIIRNRPVGSAT